MSLKSQLHKLHKAEKLLKLIVTIFSKTCNNTCETMKKNLLIATLFFQMFVAQEQKAL